MVSVVEMSWTVAVVGLTSISTVPAVAGPSIVDVWVVTSVVVGPSVVLDVVVLSTSQFMLST